MLVACRSHGAQRRVRQGLSSCPLGKSFCLTKSFEGEHGGGVELLYSCPTGQKKIFVKGVFEGLWNTQSSRGVDKFLSFFFKNEGVNKAKDLVQGYCLAWCNSSVAEETNKPFASYL